MVIAMYLKLAIKYFLVAIIVFAALDVIRIMINRKSGNWERLNRIREHYTVYSKYSWVDIRQKEQLFNRKDIRGTAGCKQKYPDVIMIGVPKCGTGSVRSSLGEHPQVAMDMNSEGVRFFSTRRHRGNLWYISQMPCSQDGQLTAENTVQYFISDDAPDRMAAFNPNIKLIITVRNPIDRLVSDFVQTQVGRPEYLQGPTFEENVFDLDTGHVLNTSLVSKSLYSVHLKRWLQYFTKEQIHVVNGDVFLNDPVSELKQIEEFLGLDPYFDYDKFAFVEERGFFCFQRSDHVECLEVGKGRKHPVIGPDTIKKLKDYFRPFNQEFIKLTGINFKWD